MQRRVGTKNGSFRLQNRVYKYSPVCIPTENNTDSNRPNQASCSGVGDIRPLAKTSHMQSANRGCESRVFLNLFSSSKEKHRRMATDFKPSAIKQICPTKTVSDGVAADSFGCITHSNLGSVDRSKGCLSTCSDVGRTSSVPTVSLRPKDLRISDTTVRPFHCPEGVYTAGESRSGNPPATSGTDFCLPGRLAHCWGDKGGNKLGTQTNCKHHFGVRFSDQHRKIAAKSDKAPSFLRSKTGPPARTSFSYRGSSPQSFGLHHSVQNCQCGPSSGMASAIGPNGKHGGRTPMVQIADAPDTVASTCILPTMYSPYPAASANPKYDLPPPGLVVAANKHHGGTDFPTTATYLNSGDRCLQHRLGGTHWNGIGSGLLVPGGQSIPHQCPRTARSFSSTETFCQNSDRGSGPHKIGQLNGCLLHKPPGRNAFPAVVHAHMGASALVPGETDQSYGGPLSRKAEYHGGCSVSGEGPSNRMDSAPGSGSIDLPSMGSSSHRSVCVGTEPSVTGVLYTQPGSEGMGSRRFFHQLEKHASIRVSPDLASTKGTDKDRGGRVQNHPHRTILATPALVSENSSPLVQSADNSTGAIRPTASTTVPDPATRGRVPPPNILDAVKQSLRSAGLSADAASLAAQGRRLSTRRTYDSRLRHYHRWCEEHTYDPCTTPLAVVGDFFMYLFHKDLTISTIRGYRSAIAAVHKGFADGSTVSNNASLAQLLRGMYVERPPSRKLVPSWDLAQVLKVLAEPPYEPLANAPLLDLSVKTVFLLATATARRRSELHALSVEPGHIRWEPSGVRLVPRQGFLTKNQSPSFLPPPIFVPDLKSFSSVPQDKLWCPVRALKWYLAQTKPLRGDTTQLFISTNKPHKAVSADSISRWIVTAIQASIKDWPKVPDIRVNAHDTRAMTTSWAYFKGVPIQDILQAAAWKTPSTFTSCYLRDVLQAEGRTGRTALSIGASKEGSTLE